MWVTFCIHFVYINSDQQKVHIIKIMSTTCIQTQTECIQVIQIIVAMQNASHISTYFDPFVVHFLNL